MSTKLDAVVVGAGPVGLSMGAALASQGLRCRVIDSAGGPAKGSRAIGIQARTLEMLEMQGSNLLARHSICGFFLRMSTPSLLCRIMRHIFLAEAKDS